MNAFRRNMPWMAVRGAIVVMLELRVALAGVVLQPGTTIEFATVQQGREALGNRDEFIQTIMSRGPAGPVGQPVGLGSMAVLATGGATPNLLATPRNALTRFASLLLPGDPARTTNCFTSAAEMETFLRLWTNPRNERERNLQTALRSLIPPVEVLATNPTDAGFQFRWTARVRQPFTVTENGVPKTWQPGNRFELATVLKQVGDEWKTVGF